MANQRTGTLAVGDPRGMKEAAEATDQSAEEAASAARLSARSQSRSESAAAVAGTRADRAESAHAAAETAKAEAEEAVVVFQNSGFDGVSDASDLPSSSGNGDLARVAVDAGRFWADTGTSESYTDAKGNTATSGWEPRSQRVATLTESGPRGEKGVSMQKQLPLYLRASSMNYVQPEWFGVVPDGETSYADEFEEAAEFAANEGLPLVLQGGGFDDTGRGYYFDRTVNLRRMHGLSVVAREGWARIIDGVGQGEYQFLMGGNQINSQGDIEYGRDQYVDGLLFERHGASRSISLNNSRGFRFGRIAGVGEGGSILSARYGVHNTVGERVIGRDLGPDGAGMLLTDDLVGFRCDTVDVKDAQEVVDATDIRDVHFGRIIGARVNTLIESGGATNFTIGGIVGEQVYGSAFRLKTEYVGVPVQNCSVGFINVDGFNATPVDDRDFVAGRALVEFNNTIGLSGATDQEIAKTSIGGIKIGPIQATAEAAAGVGNAILSACAGGGRPVNDDITFSGGSIVTYGGEPVDVVNTDRLDFGEMRIIDRGGESGNFLECDRTGRLRGHLEISTLKRIGFFHGTSATPCDLGGGLSISHVLDPTVTRPGGDQRAIAGVKADQIGQGDLSFRTEGVLRDAFECRGEPPKTLEPGQQLRIALDVFDAGSRDTSLTAVVIREKENLVLTGVGSDDTARVRAAGRAFDLSLNTSAHLRIDGESYEEGTDTTYWAGRAEKNSYRRGTRQHFEASSASGRGLKLSHAGRFAADLVLEEIARAALEWEILAGYRAQGIDVDLSVTDVLQYRSDGNHTAYPVDIFSNSGGEALGNVSILMQQRDTRAEGETSMRGLRINDADGLSPLFAVSDIRATLSNVRGGGFAPTFSANGEGGNASIIESLFDTATMPGSYVVGR